MKKRFSIGDLVRFQSPRPSARCSAEEIEMLARYQRKHTPYMHEIGLVVANDCVQGCVVSFPSQQTAVSTLSLEVC
jgi:hypothetical protein